MMGATASEIAASAARLVVEEGLEYAQAKHKAARALGTRGGRTAPMPSNESVEDQVRAYIDLFCADEQARELQTLRSCALEWMTRLAEFRPHLAGAAWRGTANRHSALHLDLYCDDPKAAEIALINLHVEYDAAGQADGRGREVPVLRLSDRVADWPEPVTLLLFVRDHDDLRGALKPDARGLTWRGDAHALQQLMTRPPAPPLPASPPPPPPGRTEPGSGAGTPRADAGARE